MLNNGKWIWIHNENINDEYADFAVDFELGAVEGAVLDISVDGNFEARLNGEICAIGACADYPFFKLYDSFSLDGLCRVGMNRLEITVWHIGVGSMTYVSSNAGLIFAVRQNGEILAASGEDTLSRKNEKYTEGLCKSITTQLGISYCYDNTVTPSLSYSKSVTVEKSYEIRPRGIGTLRLLPRVPVKIEDYGDRLLIDLGSEVAGHLDIDLESEDEQELLVVYGEHLDDFGRVPRIIGRRDFSLGFVAKHGRNEFFGGMRRIAGRYIEIEYKKPIKASYIGIRPIVYPLNKIEKHFENRLHQKIYDTSVYTLECCMHEHYEDCPWREQALYSLDSRNQMLCGYVAFGEYRYARYNLILLAKSLSDGLLRITSPTETVLPIPFFSLTFIQQLYEYVKYSGDKSVLEELLPVAQTIMTTFSSRIDESGLIPAFPAPAWNFYEWTDGNDGSAQPPANKPRYDLCLNSMYLYVLPMFLELGGKSAVDMAMMAQGIKKTLYDEDSGLFRNTSLDGRFSIVGNSLAILAGVGDEKVAERLVLKRTELTDVTLSTNAYFYDALLKCDKGYKDYIINDIEEKYGYMLSCGATTFWETIDGWHAFGDAGSLCHGWSALPVYYLDKLNNQ